MAYTNVSFEREYPILSHIAAGARELRHTLPLDRPVGSLANFGCGTGMETFCLMAATGASEGVGVDLDGDKIFEATQTLDGLKSAAVGLAHDAAHNVHPHSAHWWRDCVPPFLKSLASELIPPHLTFGIPAYTLRFVEADVTRPLDVKSGHFDLVYCRSVLYQVFCDDGPPGLESALRQMAHVLAVGGHIVAVEPLVRSPERPDPLDFTQFFERAGFRPAELPPRAADPQDSARTYRYAKPPGQPCDTPRPHHSTS